MKFVRDWIQSATDVVGLFLLAMLATMGLVSCGPQAGPSTASTEASVQTGPTFQVVGPPSLVGIAPLLDGDPSTLWVSPAGASQSVFRIVARGDTAITIDRMRWRGAEGTSANGSTVVLTLKAANQVTTYQVGVNADSWDHPLSLGQPFSISPGALVTVELTAPTSSADWSIGGPDTWLTFDPDPWFANVETTRLVPVDTIGRENRLMGISVRAPDLPPLILAENWDSSPLGNSGLLLTSERAGVRILTIPYSTEDLALSDVLGDGDVLMKRRDNPWRFMARVNPESGVFTTLLATEDRLSAPTRLGFASWDDSGLVTLHDESGRQTDQFATTPERSGPDLGPWLINLVLSPDGRGAVEEVQSVKVVEVGQTGETQAAHRSERHVRYRRLDTKEILWEMSTDFPTTVQFSPDGSLVGVGWGTSGEHVDYRIAVRRTEGSILGGIHYTDLKEPSDYFREVGWTISPDNRYLAVVDDDQETWIMDIRSREIVRHKGPRTDSFGSSYSAAFSLDQTHLYLVQGAEYR